MATYLDAILERHRLRATADTRRTDRLVEEAGTMPPCRGFRDALAGEGSRRAPWRRRRGWPVIAEVKRRSPSKGDLADPRPGRPGRRLRSGASRCLSVLTDEEHFGGSPDDLAAARAAVDLPVLRKDFTVAAHDVCRCPAHGRRRRAADRCRARRRRAGRLRTHWPASWASTRWSRSTTRPSSSGPAVGADGRSSGSTSGTW